jgi:hypothetical protein
MLIRSAIFLATFGTEFHLKPTCNFRLENHLSRRNVVTSPTMRYAEALLAAMYHAHQ